MNREIKFRGQRSDNKEWIIGSLILKNGFSIILTIEENTNYRQFVVISETVAQYTGLKDKNGVEIYEGDILERHNGEIFENGFFYPNRERSIIVWEDVAFALKSPGSESVDWAHSSYYLESSVIGNIHSNPELLK